MAASKWQVTSNSINGKTMYGVFRFKDQDKLNHSGNREDLAWMFENREDAERKASELNDIHLYR